MFIWGLRGHDLYPLSVAVFMKSDGLYVQRYDYGNEYFLRICCGFRRLSHVQSLWWSHFQLSHKNTRTGKRSRVSTILLILDRQVRDILTNLIHQLPSHRRALSITITPHLLRNSMSLCYRTCMSILSMPISPLTEFRPQNCS